MCWTTSTGTGGGAVNPPTKRDRASGPPVDEPTTTSRTAWAGSVAPQGTRTAGPVPSGRHDDVRRCARAPTRARTFGTSSSPTRWSESVTDVPPVGLAT